MMHYQRVIYFLSAFCSISNFCDCVIIETRNVEGQCSARPDWIGPSRKGFTDCDTAKHPTDASSISDTLPEVGSDGLETECVNKHDDVECTEFFRMGECEANPTWMWFNCYKSCSRCNCENKYGNDTQCRIWETWGECSKNPGPMWKNCYRACSLCEGVTVTHTVKFNILQAGAPIGSFTIGVFGNVAPITVRNFVALANHTYGFGFDGSRFHRVINNFVVQGGDITQGNGFGGRSIYGGMFKDEEFTLKHIGKGWVNMANKGEDTNESQFSILTVKADWLNERHVVFGKVLDGYDVVRLMETAKTNEKDKPMQDLTIDRTEVTKLTERLEVEKKNVVGDGTGCKNVHQKAEECAQWSNNGDCFHGHHTEWMWKNCYRDCSKCSNTFTATDPTPVTRVTVSPSSAPEEHFTKNCYNDLPDARCESWAAGGECESNPTFMQLHCYKACSVCNGYLKKRKSALFCDSEWMSLRCPKDHGILIQSAFYGRTDLETCPDEVTDDTPTDCVGRENSESMLKHSCNLYKDCSGSFSPSYFGDPCPDVPKYLLVTYDCVEFELIKQGLPLDSGQGGDSITPNS